MVSAVFTGARVHVCGKGSAGKGAAYTGATSMKGRGSIEIIICFLKGYDIGALFSDGCWGGARQRRGYE